MTKYSAFAMKADGLSSRVSWCGDNNPLFYRFLICEIKKIPLSVLVVIMKDI